MPTLKIPDRVLCHASICAALLLSSVSVVSEGQSDDPAGRSRTHGDTFEGLFSTYVSGDAHAAVRAFAQWPWPRVDAEASVEDPDPLVRAAVALFHIETGLEHTAFAGLYLRDGRTLTLELADREPHYRRSIRHVEALREDPSPGVRTIARQLLMTSEAIANNRNYHGKVRDLSLDRWFRGPADLTLVFGSRDEWWVQPFVHEGPYAFGDWCLDPCPPHTTTPWGPVYTTPLREAESTFRGAIALDDTLLEAHLRLARLQYLKGYFGDAQQQLENLRARLTPNADPLVADLTPLFLGETYDQRGRQDEALQAYVNAVARRPDAPSARLALAQRLLRSGEQRLAWQTLAELAAEDQSATDPWLDYTLGQFRHVPGWIAALRPRLGIAQPFRASRSADAPPVSVPLTEPHRPAEPPAIVGALQRRGPVFRSQVDAVRLDVRVTHRNAPVTGLTLDHFEVLEEGVRQKPTLLPATGRLNVALVVDVSHSMQPEVLAPLVRAGHRVLDQLRRDDRVALITLGQRLIIESPATTDHALVRRRLDGLRTQWAARSPTRDALFLATGLVADGDGHPLVVLLGDGGDTSSLLTEQRSIELTRAGGAPIDVIQAKPNYLHSLDLAIGRTPRPYVTAESGGQVFRVTQPDLVVALRRRFAELREHYILSYVPSGVKPRGWHRIRVRLRNTPGTVHTRSGYFAGSANSSIGR